MCRSPYIVLQTAASSKVSREGHPVGCREENRKNNIRRDYHATTITEIREH